MAEILIETPVGLSPESNLAPTPSGHARDEFGRTVQNEASKRSYISVGLRVLSGCRSQDMSPAGGESVSVAEPTGPRRLTVDLFLIGTGLSKSTLRRVGVRPFLQWVDLWAIVATVSLLAIRAGCITL